MSWYATFYLTVKKEDGKLYPFGPFDYTGKFHSVYERCGYDQELAKEFYPMNNAKDRNELISKELYHTISGLGEVEEDSHETNEFFEGTDYWNWSYLPISELPTGDYIKKGYVLMEEIEDYEENPDSFDGFYGVISPALYAKKLENELKFGRPKPQKDDYGEEYTPRSVSEYSFYVWPDYNCIEYEAYKIRQALYLMREWYEIKDSKEEIYIICTQG